MDYHHSVYVTAMEALEKSALQRSLNFNTADLKYQDVYKTHILNPNSGSPGPQSKQGRFVIYYLYFGLQTVKKEHGHTGSAASERDLHATVFFNTLTFASNPYPRASNIQFGGPRQKHANELVFDAPTEEGDTDSMHRLKNEVHPFVISDVVLKGNITLLYNDFKFNINICSFVGLFVYLFDFTFNISLFVNPFNISLFVKTCHLEA